MDFSQPTNDTESIELSVVIPFYNEEDNIVPLYEEVRDVLIATGRTYEMIFVNDGSKDDTLKKGRAIAEQDDNVQMVDLMHNYGQTSALMAGINIATGNIIISMDGDGQNDPSSIPNLLEKLDEGYSVVSGWRVDRQDKPLSRKLPSRIANWLIAKTSGVQLHDYGCALKAYKREVIEQVRLYGEMHRFVPIYTAWQGGKIAEVPVKHRARLHGESKYGLNRIYKVILDLLLVLFMGRFMTKPIYIFGGFGLLSLALAVIHTIWALWLKFFEGVAFITTPLPTLISTFFVTSVICILMGLLAEILMRTYFEAQNMKTYRVKALYKKD